MENVMIVIFSILAIFTLSIYSYTKGWDEGYKQRQIEEHIEKLEELLKK